MSFWVEETNREIKRDETSKKPKFIPLISTGLDSVRSYTFELDFSSWCAAWKCGSDNIEDMGKEVIATSLTKAVKHVTTIGFTSEALEIKEMDDDGNYVRKKFAALMEPNKVTITFDHILDFPIYDYLSRVIYFGFGSGNRGVKPTGTEVGIIPEGNKRLRVKYFGPAGKLVQTVELEEIEVLGLVAGESSYSDNDFHTLELEFTFSKANCKAA